MNWSVYILECKDGTLYTGITNNLIKRIEKHNSGKGAKYLAPRSRRPAILVWSVFKRSKSGALKLEFKIKGLTRKKKKLLISGQFEF